MKKGIAVCEGIGIGKAVVLEKINSEYTQKSGCDPKAQKERLTKAIEQFSIDNAKIAEEVKRNVGEKEALIIESHTLMLNDPYMLSEIDKLINEGNNAEYAFGTVCDSFITMFSSVDDEMTKQRAADVRDIKSDVLGIMAGVKKQDLSDLSDNSVIVTEELTPSVTAGLNPAKVIGIVTSSGSRTSHAAILARTMGIPAVLSVEGGISDINNNDEMIVDGANGFVFVNPDNNEIEKYKATADEYRKMHDELKSYLEKPTVTADGTVKRIACNIGKPEDINGVLDNSGEEIGLFRTEFLFIDRNSAPTEDEQFEAYKKVAIEMKGKPVIVRTLDIGGDKDIPYLGLKKEENPFLGFRAIRYCLKNEDLFRTQLRALLKAAVYGDIRIMIPLVVSLAELRAAKKLINEVEQELIKQGEKFKTGISVGVMIETPAAFIMAEEFAKEADFFSIGTNDLTGYVLAVDRGNPDTEYLYSVYDPSVLRAIKQVITAAKNAGIPVGMCGESASDPMLIPLLLAFGLDEFSVNSSQVLKVRSVISKWSKSEAENLTDKVMSCNTADEIVEILKSSVK